MDELDRLKGAFESEQVAPRRGAREAALAAALGVFDAEKVAARQGSGVVGRLRNAARAAFEILTGKRPMTQLSMRHALAGGVSLAVLTLAVMTAANIRTIEGFGFRDTREPIGVPPIDREIDAKKPDALRRADVPTVTTAQAPRIEPKDEERADEQLGDKRAAQPLPAPPAESAAQRAADASSIAPLNEPAPAAPPSMDALSSNMAQPGIESFAAKVAGQVSSMEEPIPQPGYHDQGRDRFQSIETNPTKVTAEEPVSTFSIDVDSSSYSFVRASLNNGVLPQDDAVRVEELVNYFPYDYPGPQSAEEPFAASVTVMPTPWNAGTRLVNIGIKGYDVAATTRPHANLVFLIDTSGSMEEPNKLPLLINSMKLLVDDLKPDDSVAIVTYAGSAGTVLEPTKASDKGKIDAALENLAAGGSTAGAEGIRQAYQLAEQNFDKNGVNRVILATDGDFNVGITDTDELEGFVERERASGIFLSVLGFGMGNYNDELMQTLVQNGNGAAAYIDTLSEARKVLVDESTSTLFPIAKDVKIQVEFNPATVSEYRLIGYENRLLNREDFNNDKVDAGEIGSGHTVTAIYEITPKGSASELVDGLRYQSKSAPAADGTANEYGFLRIRYKLPDSDTSKLIETPISTANEVDATGGGDTAREARFASSVAAFGQILRGGRYTGAFGYDDVIALANASKGADAFGYRSEFVNLVRLAKSAAPLERLQPQ
jgi:Ca-activated chloride channel family protein